MAPPTAAPQAGVKCPAPKTCDRYAFLDGKPKGWRDYDGDGLIEIEVWLYTQPPHGSSLAPGQIEAAIREAITVWEEANPRLRFVDQGITPDPPRQGDRVNGRGPGQQEYRVTLAYGGSVTHRRDFDNFISEADIVWTPTDAGDSLSYNPCNRHRDGGCGDSRSGKIEIAEVLVHEMGHILGLDDLTAPETSQMTMYTYPSPKGHRFPVTLAYGDRLGLDRLYPCGCPLPPTYEP